MSEIWNMQMGGFRLGLVMMGIYMIEIWID